MSNTSGSTLHLALGSLLGDEQMLGRLIEALPDCVVIFDQDGRIRYVNQACVELLGWGVDELLAETIADTVHDDDRSMVADAIGRVGRDEPGEAIEIRSRDRDGNDHWMSWHAGRIGPWFLAVGRDATQRRATYDLLADREAFISSVLDTLLSAVVTIDEHGTILSANPAVRDMFGYEESELIGRNVGVLMEAADAGLHDHYIERYRATNVSSIVGTRQSVVGRTGRRKDGTTFPIGIEVSEFRNGGQRCFTGVMSDLTQLAVTVQQLERARAVADAAAYQKASLLAQVSHELRTPLNAILGFSELIEVADDGAHADAVAAIRNAGRQLRGMIDEIIELNATEAGEIDLHPEPVRFEATVDQCAGALDLVHPDRITVDHTAADAIVVHVDRSRLGEVIQRLMSFAVDLAAADRPITVTTRRTADGYGRVEVTVPGFEPSRHRLTGMFEPFGQRAGDDTTDQGANLGLAVAARLVRALQGTIGIDDVDGESVLWCELPGRTPG